MRAVCGLSLYHLQLFLLHSDECYRKAPQMRHETVEYNHAMQVHVELNDRNAARYLAVESL